MSDDQTAAAVRARVVIERTYKAQAEELWDLWTTKEGFELWWGPEGFRVEVHSLEPRVGGRLHYDMLADTPEMVEAMRRMGRPSSHATRARFVEIKPHEHLTIAHVIDFLPGVESYESAMRVDLLASRDQVRMVVTLEPMHDEEFTKMSTLGFSSQLTKLDKRFERRAEAIEPTSPLPAATPVLMFEGQAEAAMTWYVSLLRNSGTRSIERYGAGGPGKEGSVVQARFTLNGREFMCFDSPIKHQFTFTPAISILVECESEAEVDRLFAALSAGGRVLMPLDSYPFSKRFGWLADKVWRLLATTLCP